MLGNRSQKPDINSDTHHLVIIWHLLSEESATFHDLGPGYYDSRINPERKKCNHIRELEALGYIVTLHLAA